MCTDPLVDDRLLSLQQAITCLASKDVHLNLRRRQQSHQLIDLALFSVRRQEEAGIAAAGQGAACSCMSYDVRQEGREGKAG